jgi:2-hydroxychromene-2-carboxylate isomerase
LAVYNVVALAARNANQGAKTIADVEFFFDFVISYTYLARTQLDAFAARRGARFNTWPMHLLNLMKMVDLPPSTVLCNIKRKYAGQGLARCCARYQIPLKHNPHLRGNRSLTLKGALVAQEMSLEDQYNRAAFSAFWPDTVIVTDRGAPVQHLESVGLNGSASLTKAAEAEYAKRLESNNQAAADREVLGSPTFIGGGDIFFGNDRLDFLEARLKKSAAER